MPINLTTNKKPLFSKIDYGTIPQTVEQTMNGVRQTMSDFTNFRKSLGIFTDEEKQLAEQQARQREKEQKERLANLEANMQASQQRFNEEGLWNSEDVYDVYNVYETDPVKQEEFRRNGETTAGVLSTIATLPFTAGMMGWVPAITTTATGAVGGYAGAYGGQQLGQYLDNKYGTNTTPWLSTIGGVAGGILGGGLGYKGWEGATNQYLINKAFKSGQLKYGQPTAYTAYHQSATPITKFKFPFKRWDVKKHGADPNGAFFTVGEPAAAGFLAERPYTGQFQVKVQKPLIQTGELTGQTKNGLRNAIVRRARRDGADAVFFDGIADNTLQNQQILFAMDNADIGYRGMVSTPFKQGNWQLPRGMRNNDKNLVSMQDLVPSKFISIPGLKPIGGKIIADNVVNHPHILDRTRRLQRIYKRMVDPDYIPTNNWRKSRDTSPGMKIVDDIDITHTNSPTGTTENIGGYYSPSEDMVYVRRRGTPDSQASAAFHEELHGYDFGQDAINDWIIKHLIDPEKVKGMSPRAQKYYLSSQEAPVHALQHGFNKGLDIGAPYPGDTVFDELLDSGIGGSLYYFKTQTPKDKRRLWRAMTGDLFVKKQGGKIENPDH